MFDKKIEKVVHRQWHYVIKFCNILLSGDSINIFYVNLSEETQKMCKNSNNSLYLWFVYI
jgi:hypothetical protein